MSRATARQTFHHGGGTVVGGHSYDAADPLVAAFPDFFDVDGPAPTPEPAAPVVIAGRPRGRRAASEPADSGGDSE